MFPAARSCTPLPTQLTQRELAVLKGLVKDGNAPFTEMDATGGLERGASRYIFERLRKRRIIKRVTMTMTALRIKYNAVLLLDVIDASSPTRKALLGDMIEERTPLLNNYSLVGDIETPFGLVYIMPVFAEPELGEAVARIKGGIAGIKVSSMIITNLIKGSLCQRKFDNDYSSQYEILTQIYGVDKKKDRAVYE